MCDRSAVRRALPREQQVPQSQDWLHRQSVLVERKGLVTRQEVTINVLVQGVDVDAGLMQQRPTGVGAVELADGSKNTAVPVRGSRLLVIVVEGGNPAVRLRWHERAEGIRYCKD